MSEFVFEPERSRFKKILIPPRFPSPGPPSMVGKVVSSAGDIAVGKFLLVNPVDVLGPETEGSSASISSGSGPTVPVYLIGPALPRTGELLVCRFVDFRWVAERGRDKPPSNPCLTTWPRVLTYKGNVGQSQAGFYFAQQAYTEPEAPYTLTYQARPASIPKVLQLEYFNQPGGVVPPYYTRMPESAWFSELIPVLLFGNPSYCYFYLWMKSCYANVMIIDVPYGTYGGYGTTPEGAGNNIHTYNVPTGDHGRDAPPLPSGADFGMEEGVQSRIGIVLWGTHGGDDVIPDPQGGAGYPGAVIKP